MPILALGLEQPRLPRPPIRLVVPVIIGVAFLMEQLDATVIMASLPAMGASLGVSPLRLNLAITSYVFGLAVFMPISGWMADRYGARRVFVTAIAVFTLGSILCGIATSLNALIGARVLQGLGGAMMTPVGRLILLRSFSRQELVAAISYMSLPVLIGPLLGPLIGGLLTTYANWRWIFFVNVPIGLLGLVLTLRYVRDPAPHSGSRRRFDLPGFAIIGVALVLLQTSLDNVVHPFMPAWAAWGAVGVAAALFLLYAALARRRVDPALDLHLFRIRAFRVGSISGGLTRVSLNAVPFLLQLQLQLGFGFTPIAASLLVFVSGLGAVAMKPMTTAILRATGFKWLLVCNALVGSALVAGLAWFEPDTPVAVMIGYLFVYGISRTLMFNSIQAITFAEVPTERQSAAVSLAGVVQQLSMGFGVSLSAAALAVVAGHVAAPSSEHFQLIFLLMALVPLGAISGFLRLRPSDGAVASGQMPQSSET